MKNPINHVRTDPVGEMTSMHIAQNQIPFLSSEYNNYFERPSEVISAQIPSLNKRIFDSGRNIHSYSRQKLLHCIRVWILIKCSAWCAFNNKYKLNDMKHRWLVRVIVLFVSPYKSLSLSISESWHRILKGWVTFKIFPSSPLDLNALATGAHQINKNNWNPYEMEMRIEFSFTSHHKHMRFMEKRQKHVKKWKVWRYKNKNHSSNTE